MTRTASARVAGATFLLYIAIGITQMVISPGGAKEPAARLALMAQHAGQVRINMLLGVLTVFTALTLAVALYGLTRDEDRELALLGLVCRAGEGVLGALPVSLPLLWLATTRPPDAPDPATAAALAALLFQVGGWQTTVCATLFAVGSTAFSWLLLRGHMIPRALAWLGVFASLLLVLVLPLRLVGVLTGTVPLLAWIPMAAFEIPLGFWLLVKGVAPLRSKPELVGTPA